MIDKEQFPLLDRLLFQNERPDLVRRVLLDMAANHPELREPLLKLYDEVEERTAG